MKSLRFHQVFMQHFRDRIKYEFDLLDDFHLLYSKIINKELYSFDEEQLTKNVRYIKFTNEAGLIFTETENEVILLDIGTSEQISG